MKKILIFFILVVFAACGNDNSKNPVEPNFETSSSSKKQDGTSSSMKESSSSEEQSGTSSSMKESSSGEEQNGTSSSMKECSSGEEQCGTSSSMKESSSSEEQCGTSSSMKESSSSVEQSGTSSSMKESSSSVEQSGTSSSMSNDNSSSSTFYSSFEESSSSDNVENSSSSSIGCIYGNPIHDIRDGQTYKTVKIGEQEWMAENLNFNYKKGNAGSSRSYCYGKIDTNCDKYGRLYPWTAAIDSVHLDSAFSMKCGYHGKNCSIPKDWKGVCPDNWHLPTKDEWLEMITYLGSLENAGKKLKSVNEWIENSNNTRGTDDVCFAALPAGYTGNYVYYNIGNRALFWSVDYFDEKNAYAVEFSNNANSISIRNESTYDAFSIRCIKN